MSSAVILQHLAHEGPGRIVPILRDFGIPTEVRRLYQGDEVPTDLDELRVLIVLGGSMSVTDIGNAKYPFLAQEVELIKRVIAADRPMLGICLGAQLLAHSAGAKVYPNVKPGAKPEDPSTPMPEFGWGPVNFPFPGGTEPLVMGMVDGAPMFHWHYDTFDLPRLPAPTNPPTPPSPPAPSGNALLSSTRTCKNQAFRFKNRLFGFQYHFELLEAGIEALLANGKEDIQKAMGAGGEARIREDTKKFYPRYNRLGERLIKNFVQFLKVY
ncbi:MAG: gamma-glutamyl-gamma-aminobutyrate hydrolase family protein [Planctomycetota bacterium]|nr:gamma-glutamyl-gamma-aminobutyrate hydrolase family protein [Planctomycetota bacterium]